MVEDEDEVGKGGRVDGDGEDGTGEGALGIVKGLLLDTIALDASPLGPELADEAFALVPLALLVPLLDNKLLDDEERNGIFIDKL